jgi:hypothetical protein
VIGVFHASLNLSAALRTIKTITPAIMKIAMPSASHQAPNEGYFDFLYSQNIKAIANDNAASTPSQNALFNIFFDAWLWLAQQKEKPDVEYG